MGLFRSIRLLEHAIYRLMAARKNKTKVADWLFSTENHENGQPKGIGLSLWRFNVGAGSAEQGEASQIASPWTAHRMFPSGRW